MDPHLAWIDGRLWPPRLLALVVGSLEPAGLPGVDLREAPAALHRRRGQHRELARSEEAEEAAVEGDEVLRAGPHGRGDPRVRDVAPCELVSLAEAEEPRPLGSQPDHRRAVFFQEDPEEGERLRRGRWDGEDPPVRDDPEE